MGGEAFRSDQLYGGEDEDNRSGLKSSQGGEEDNPTSSAAGGGGNPILFLFVFVFVFVFVCCRTGVRASSAAGSGGKPFLGAQFPSGGRLSPRRCSPPAVSPLLSSFCLAAALQASWAENAVDGISFPAGARL